VFYLSPRSGAVFEKHLKSPVIVKCSYSDTHGGPLLTGGPPPMASLASWLIRPWALSTPNCNAQSHDTNLSLRDVKGANEHASYTPNQHLGATRRTEFAVQCRRGLSPSTGSPERKKTSRERACDTRALKHRETLARVREVIRRTRASATFGVANPRARRSMLYLLTKRP